MKFLAFFLLLFPIYIFSQTSQVQVIVKDSKSKESVPFANVRLGNYKNVTDIDGKVTFSDIPYGDYQVVAEMIDSVSQKVTINQPSQTINLEIGSSIELQEVTVTTSFIRDDRKTPLAVTKIDAKEINEELGSRDLPMILNATPGVYATQQGGGEGDSRMNIRGFQQSNIGVMIDGVPVNDMENGAVYWSNWFGLDVITAGVQVQRGLGATKIAMPSVGGTINIVTSGLTAQKKFTFKQEYGSGDLTRTSVAYNSGLLKGDWGFTVAGSFKKTNGWVDGTPSIGGFYYAKVQKRFKHHLLSLSAFGAPQKHAQRAFDQIISYWDTTDARKLGADINPLLPLDRGIQYNEHWGYISPDYHSLNTMRVKGKNIMAERMNYFNKSQITLKDFWNINDKVSFSNIVYMSIGKGGGTKLQNYSSAAKDENGQLDWDAIIENNREHYDPLFGTEISTIDPLYSPTLYKSSNVITASVNNHYWVGYLGQLNYEINRHWTVSAGLDYRYYAGIHYKEIKDLLGGDYFINNANNNSLTPMKKVGDKIADPNKGYEDQRLGFVQWGGAFGQVEFSSARWSAFVNISGNYNGYQGVDMFQKRELKIGDTVLTFGANDTINYQGKSYTTHSEGVKYNHTGYKWIPGGTIKVGANYLIGEHSSVFANLGYLSRTPMFTNVVDNTYNKFFAEIKNEVIQAVELGYNFRSKRLSFSVNTYYTNWKNKPFPNGLAVPDPLDPLETIRVNIQGMDAVHMGLELDGKWNIVRPLTFETAVSLGDWRWNSNKTVELPAYNTEVTFNAKGVHVGDAPQTMVMGALRYEPIKNLYFKVQYQYFARFYSDFNPFILNGANSGRDSWKAPSYGLLNIYAGYRYVIKHSYALSFNASIINTLNSRYIADAILSSTYGPGFDINSVGVMYGMGLRFNVGISLQILDWGGKAAKAEKKKKNNK